MIEFIDLFLKIVSVAALALALVLLIVFRSKKAGAYVGARSLLFSFVVSSIATFGSLFYSEIALYAPCKLCWLQRIFMYPQIVLLGVGLIKKDKNILNYSIVLSLIGFLIAAYHYGLNWYSELNPSVVCPLGQGGGNCAKAYFTWGFMNIPLMSLTAFLLLTVFYFYYKKYGNAKTESAHDQGKKNPRRS